MKRKVECRSIYEQSEGNRSNCKNVIAYCCVQCKGRFREASRGDERKIRKAEKKWEISNSHRIHTKCSLLQMSSKNSQMNLDFTSFDKKKLIVKCWLRSEICVILQNFLDREMPSLIVEFEISIVCELEKVRLMSKFVIKENHCLTRSILIFMKNFFIPRIS